MAPVAGRAPSTSISSTSAFCFTLAAARCYPSNRTASKDVVWLASSETVIVEAHYLLCNGVYMFYCHNLIHENQDMMAAFNAIAL